MDYKWIWFIMDLDIAKIITRMAVYKVLLRRIITMFHKWLVNNELMGISFIITLSAGVSEARWQAYPGHRVRG